MKTTVDIPNDAFRELLRHTKARTKREAIVAAILEFNRRKRMAALVKFAGSSDTMMSHAELMKSRSVNRAL